MAFTYFFRDLQTLEMIRDRVLPAVRTRRFIHIWDAGCAMGPEPYSLAIILRENMGHMIFRNVKIHATDIDESGQFGEIIGKGVYPEEQLKRIPDPIRERYFQPNGCAGHLQITADIRNCVTYETHDLLSLQPVRKDLSLVLCKNVLLHFTEEERVAVIRMFHEALVPGGFFVTEQTQKLPAGLRDLFETVAANAQVHRKRDDASCTL